MRYGIVGFEAAVRFTLSVLLALSLSGCRHTGPSTIQELAQHHALGCVGISTYCPAGTLYEMYKGECLCKSPAKEGETK